MYLTVASIPHRAHFTRLGPIAVILCRSRERLARSRWSASESLEKRFLGYRLVIITEFARKV